MARVSRLRAGAPVAGSLWPLGGVVILAALLAVAGVVVSAGILSPPASEAPLEVQQATLGAGDLPPGGAIDARLIFVAPAGGVPIALLVRDGAGGRSRVTPRPSR